MKRGRLLSFEGVDGAGKTTQINLLEDWLQSQQIPYIRTREPGGTPLGLEIRRLLLDRPELELDPLAESFLFQADRAQHFAKVIEPALDAGKLVLTDRCFDASIAYQGYARGLGASQIEQLSLLATRRRVPDLTILLDLEATRVRGRTDVAQGNGQREERNRLDQESEAFFNRVREGLLQLANAHPERIKVINAARPVEQVHQKVIEQVKPLLFAIIAEAMMQFSNKHRCVD